jgi:hypothetical protein
VKVGAVFPQIESGTDPIAIREYAQAIEEMGYTHILVYDHVLGADVSTRPNWSGPYTSDSLFHEPFVLYGYLAGQAGCAGRSAERRSITPRRGRGLERG